MAGRVIVTQSFLQLQPQRTTFFPSFTEQRRFLNFFSKDKQKQVLWKNKVIDMVPLNKSWENRAIAVAGDTKL
jgi:hypothetical protein